MTFERMHSSSVPFSLVRNGGRGSFVKRRGDGFCVPMRRHVDDLYYGDEIGLENLPSIPPAQMRDPRELNMPGRGLGRDPYRSPMQWSSARHADFTSAEPWLPQSTDAATRNVAAQRTAARSMLSLYRSIIELRRRHPALTTGSYRPINAPWPLLVYELALLYVCAIAFRTDALSRGRQYYAWFLFLEGTSLGVFLSLDLFLLYVFFDLSLVGAYFLIGRWGHADAQRTALKYFLYTFSGSLIMLLGILGLYLAAKPLTFDMRALIAMQPSALVALGQRAFKRRIAYTSVNRMGYAVPGVASAGTLGSGTGIEASRRALTGATLEMTAQTLITGA